MRAIICFFLYFIFFHSPSFADDLNKPKGLSSQSQVKILKVEAQSYAHNQQNKMYQNGTGCNQQVGVTNVEKGARAPREVSTVIKGDVISVCK